MPGNWSVWTKKAVELLELVHGAGASQDIGHLLTMGIHIFDSNAAFFDAANNFVGCITGIHEVLRRQGLLEGIWTLSENKTLSPG